MKDIFFQCPHCGQPITPPEIPSDVLAAALGSRKSPAKAEASRRNAKLPRKRKPVEPDKPVSRTKPEPSATMAEPVTIPVVDNEPLAELHKAAPAITTLAEVKDKAVKSLTLAEARAKALKLKPLVANKVRDYSGAYS